MWIYATAADPEVRRPEEALRLARLGVSLSRNPVSLDTLAEAGFAAGNRKEAQEAILAAIALAPPNPDYYLKQRDRFFAR